MRSSPSRQLKRGVWFIGVCSVFALAWTQSDSVPTPIKASTSDVHGGSSPPEQPAIVPEPPQLPAAVAKHDPPSDLDPVSELGQHARGFYYSGNAAAALGPERFVRAVRSAGMNAAVIDLKDERGHVMFDTRVPELQKSKRLAVADMQSFVRDVRREGIYVIGRIVCFSDPIVPRSHPERAIQDGRPYKKPGGLWASWGRRNTWLDPYNTDNHAMILALAQEAQQLGVDEIQFDYIRFPVDKATEFAVFPAQSDQSRDDVLLGMLAQIDRAVSIPLGVDVFGLTTMPWGRPEALGQNLELWTKHVEVISPMLYLNGMRAWMDDDRQNRAERLIAVGISNLRKRIGDVPVIRPFLQGFASGADHYDHDFITQQIRGARRAGADGFLFWHPASRYALIREAMQTPAANALTPFPNAPRVAARERTWSAGPRQAPL